MLQTARLIRFETSYAYGTFGIFLLGGEGIGVTLEPSSRWNAKGLSCIPTGQYMCKRIVSPKFGETFQIMHVPNREQILFHPGNVVADTEGCVILGQHKGKLNGDRAVLNSGKTFEAFMGMLKGINGFLLTIMEVY